MSPLLLLIVAAVVAAALAVLAFRTSVALLLSLGIAMSVFAGNSRYMGFPIPPDRVLILGGIVLFVLGLERTRSPMRLRFRFPHVLLLVLGAYALMNCLVAGTLDADGVYALLDRLSITAFLLFAVAPLVFSDRRSRNIFLVVMVVLGGYLGTTAVMEGTGLRSAVVPSYIDDPTVGIHFDRARGPMTEAAGFGLALFECAVVAALAHQMWRGRLARFLALVVVGLCLAGTLFTLTRAVWIGVILGILAVCAISAQWRRRLLPALLGGAVILLVVLSSSSSLSGKVNERSGDQRPVWDRLNLADAGLRAIEENPAFGVGWRHFIDVGPNYFRLLPDIPQTGTTIDIHNALISIGAELGLVGLLLWVGVLASTVFAAMFWRPPPELEQWRIALVAMGVQWAVVAMFTPFAYTFSMFFMFTFAGIVAGPRFLRERPSRASLWGTGAGSDPDRRTEALSAAT